MLSLHAVISRFAVCEFPSKTYFYQIHLIYDILKVCLWSIHHLKCFHSLLFCRVNFLTANISLYFPVLYKKPKCNKVKIEKKKSRWSLKWYALPEIVEWYLCMSLNFLNNWNSLNFHGLRLTSVQPWKKIKHYCYDCSWYISQIQLKDAKLSMFYIY